MTAGDRRWGWWIAARRLATRLRRGGQWTRRGGLAVAGGLLLAAGVGLALLWIRAPDLYTGAATKDTATATTRAGVLALAAAGIAALAASTTLTETKRANRASDDREREAQVTDRYTKAIGQLGDIQLAIRLGGIYALERIAVDSERDHRTIVEVLSAFVRTSSQPAASNRSPDDQSGARPEEQPVPAAAPAGDTGQTLTTDVQAALTVLGRLPSRPGVSRGDLTGAHLAGAWLDGATLTGAILSRANLADARLGRANLTDTHLHGATLTDARLGRANLADARLDGANLAGADPRGATLTGAELGWANLATTKNLTQQQLDSAHGDENTRLPAGLQRPAHWSAAD